MMRWLRHPVKAVGGLLDRVVAAVGAVLFSQIPAFVTHYLQRLGGHVDEAARNVRTWQEIADKLTGGRLDALIRLGQASHEEFGKEAARKCAEDIARHDALRQALEAIESAPAWLRSPTFLCHADGEIARAAARQFTPNVPMDLESLVYAVIGLVLAFLLFTLAKRGVVGIGRGLRRRLARPRAAAEDDTPEPS